MEEDDMRGRMVVWLVAGAVLALGTPVRAGQDVMLDHAGLKKQAFQNKALDRFLRYNGYPDAAELKWIFDQAPWDDHEVTLYYLGAHKEISFARARILGRPEVASTRYERVLTDADIRTLQARIAQMDTASTASSTNDGECKGSATERAECSATRAEHAADRVDAAAVRAEKAADRTEAVVEKMSRPAKVARN
jgi:hypothetical protein